MDINTANDVGTLGGVLLLIMLLCLSFVVV